MKIVVGEGSCGIASGAKKTENAFRALLEESGLSPRGGMELAAATVRGLILTVSHREQIGEQYPKVLETLVRGACRELFREE